MDKKLISEAKEYFGRKIVSEVIATVELSDPDCAYSIYQDEGKEEHAECVEFLYF